MTKIISLNATTLFEGLESRPSPERLIEGDPISTTWLLEQDVAQAGIWGSTVGAQRMVRGERTWEMFTILEGEVEVVEVGQVAQRFGPGDTVIIKPNFQGVWRTLRPVKKSFVTLELPAQTCHGELAREIWTAG